ncbi:MAG TPA: pilin, partial [Patescibacteria group bacterium]|nr:pilin [Patescibacteria group bacterium]
MRHLRQNFFQKTTVLVFLFFSISIIFFVSGDLVIAQGADVGLEAVSDVSLASTDPRLIAMRVIRVLLGLIGIIALSITVYAGYLWMTSAGNEEQVARAKNMLKQGVIGLLIILSALGIVTFIMSLLLQAVGGISETGRPVGFAGRGALGAGVLKSHYPPRDAVEIPRNINIILTFKVAMDIDTLAIWNDDDADGVREAEDRWELDTTSVRVIRNSDDPQALLTARVYFVPSEFADNENVKTLVIKPDDYLGSPDNDELHTVTLTNTIKTKTNQTAFFINYIWQFTTNTELDFTPPYIIGMELAPEYTADIPTIPVDQQYIDEYDSKRAHANIIPMPYATQTLANTPEPCNNPQHALGACHPWPRNLLVQINFNEAVNPITAAGRPNETLADSAYVGIFQYIGDGVRDMFDVTAPATDDWKVLNGEWRMSTDYRTIEFWADIDPSNV